jgi:hypothetical protein
MIELPGEFLNALFSLLIIFAILERSRQRSRGEAALAPQAAHP